MFSITLELKSPKDDQLRNRKSNTKCHFPHPFGGWWAGSGASMRRACISQPGAGALPLSHFLHHQSGLGPCAPQVGRVFDLAMNPAQRAPAPRAGTARWHHTPAPSPDTTPAPRSPEERRNSHAKEGETGRRYLPDGATSAEYPGTRRASRTCVAAISASCSCSPTPTNTSIRVL